MALYRDLPMWYKVKKQSCSVVSDSLWPMDCSPPGSSVHGIFQAWILEYSFSKNVSFLCRKTAQCLWTCYSKLESPTLSTINILGQIILCCRRLSFILGCLAASLISIYLLPINILFIGHANKCPLGGKTIAFMNLQCFRICYVFKSKLKFKESVVHWPFTWSCVDS